MSKNGIEEIWKDIENYEGLYQISNIGRVKSFHPRYKKPKILKTHIRTNGYVYICLHKDKELYTVDIHRLVAKAFVENEKPNEYLYVLHLDDNPQNNIYTNLKWGTQKENCNTENHRKLLSEKMSTKVGEKNNFYGHKHTEETKNKIREARSKKIICDGVIYNSILECANYFNVSTTTIKKYIDGKIKNKKINKNFMYYNKESD